MYSDAFTRFFDFQLNLLICFLNESYNSSINLNKLVHGEKNEKKKKTTQWPGFDLDNISNQYLFRNIVNNFNKNKTDCALFAFK